MKNDLYKRFKLNPKKVKAGDLMKAANKRKAEGKGFPKMKKHKKVMGDEPSMANWRPTKGGFNYPKPSPASQVPQQQNMGQSKGIMGVPGGANMAKSKKKHKTHKKEVERESPVGSLNAKRMNDGGPNGKKMNNQAAEYTKSNGMMCKSCGKKHPIGKHMKKKGIKLVPPSKGHKPKGVHGRAAVAQLGRTKTTGNFARIEAKYGKGAAVNAFQNARKARA